MDFRIRQCALLSMTLCKKPSSPKIIGPSLPFSSLQITLLIQMGSSGGIDQVKIRQGMYCITTPLAFFLAILHSHSINWSHIPRGVEKHSLFWAFPRWSSLAQQTDSGDICYLASRMWIIWSTSIWELYPTQRQATALVGNVRGGFSLSKSCCFYYGSLLRVYSCV
jgi:hypothetical protein